MKIVYRILKDKYNYTGHLGIQLYFLKSSQLDNFYSNQSVSVGIYKCHCFSQIKKGTTKTFAELEPYPPQAQV